MQQIFPNYYCKFKCIADKCKHSCCIGWEIDVDEDTMSIYNSLDGEFAEKIKANIHGDPPHFLMKEDGRCPFLNDRGLCDIITEYGEDAICDICYLHPRFSNAYDNFIETGLGLCCEEAVRIILTQEEKFSVELPLEAEDEAFFKERNEAFKILQNRNLPILERFETLAKKYGMIFNFSNADLYNLFISLERLDKAWEKELEKLRVADCKGIFQREDMQIFFEQLACSFIFRHFKNGVAFTLLSCWTIGAMVSSCESQEQMLEVVRAYSSEIEYSEENVEKINAYLDQY